MKSFSFAGVAFATFAILATTVAGKTGKDWQLERTKDGIELSRRPIECPIHKPGFQCVYIDEKDSGSDEKYNYDIFPVNGGKGMCFRDFDEPAKSKLAGQKAHTSGCTAGAKDTWVVTCNPQATKYVVIKFNGDKSTSFHAHGGAKAAFGKGSYGKLATKYEAGHHKVAKRNSVVVKCPPRPHK